MIFRLFLLLFFLNTIERKFICSLFLQIISHFLLMNVQKYFTLGKSPVDMHLVYKQSLMSPSNCPLKFQTPAFKAGKNCFKMVDLGENYKK